MFRTQFFYELVMKFKTDNAHGCYLQSSSIQLIKALGQLLQSVCFRQLVLLALGEQPSIAQLAPSIVAYQRYVRPIQCTLNRAICMHDKGR